jgi:NhaP-type Na+/H+ or K+/H+ antiporter
VGGKWADKHVPAHIRHLLAAESGCNDGAAFPFLFIALYLIMNRPDTGAAIRDWILLLWLCECPNNRFEIISVLNHADQVLLGIFIGSALGFGFRHLMKFCQRHNLIDRQSYVAQYISLSILTIGVCTLIGSDDLLASFFCGTVFAWDGFFNKQTEESVFSSVIDTLFNVAAFIFVGAWMPFSSFENEELTLSVWRLIVIAILILLLRRLPIMIATYRWIPDIKTFREAVFSGHFGPIGIGAVFISTLAVQTLDRADLPPNHQTELLIQTIQPIVAFMVLCSITIHGLSIPSFSLGRRVHSVSRTWSRRETLTAGGQPDWTNQARMVTRGEDIVINRDRETVDLEKGEGFEEKRERRTPSEQTLETGPMVESHISDETKVTFTEPAPQAEEPAPPPSEPEEPRRDYREQVPPDATAPIQEWIEGHHKVIEKKMGPGSDVSIIFLAIWLFAQFVIGRSHCR